MTEMMMLAAIGAWALILTVIQGTRNVIVLGLPTAAGNDYHLATWSGWHDRLNRAIRNLIEAIVIFCPIVVAVQILGITNETTALGAQVFFYGRVAHTLVFAAGIPYLRTIAWFAGVVGIIMVASPLL
jgi:uncharacterized MAPEG superfamily protein